MDNSKSTSNTPYVCAGRRNQWNSDYAMNKLCALEKMGFKISWNLIAIGLFGDDEIPPLITRSNVVEYLDSLLIGISEQTDNIIALICEEENPAKFDSVLRKLASEDASDIAIQKRKWRACLLKNLIDNINQDYLQGLLELVEFWVSMGKPDDCPQTFPNSDNKKSVQDYFTQASYEFCVGKNRRWLDEEVLSIVKLED